MKRSPGKLDGITLLRYAHIYQEQSGGIELYLKNLDRVLLERNKMTIIQMHMVNDIKRHNVAVEEIGLGKMIWIPCHLLQPKNHAFTLDHFYALLAEAGIFRFPRRFLRYFRRNGHILLQKRVLEVIQEYKANLISFHWLNLDSQSVVAAAVKNRIPYVIVNHFENEIYNSIIIKQQIVNARALAGLTNVNVPEHISDRFTCLSDGIDTTFFDPEQASDPNVTVEKPIIFMPSRIVEHKGHCDLIEATACLKSIGVNISLVFAGRTDSTELLHHLKHRIAQLKMQEDVMFLGPLDQESLRNWYGYCSIVALPTQSEGIGRVLLEAQAMKKPVIAYETGGTPSAIRHGETGFILPKGDVRQLTDKLAGLIKDDRKRIQMGQCARDFIINQFGLIEFVKRHEEFYLHALTI